MSLWTVSLWTDCFRLYLLWAPLWLDIAPRALGVRGDNEVCLYGQCLYGQIASGYTTLWAPLWLDIAPRALWQPRG